MKRWIVRCVLALVALLLVALAVTVFSLGPIVKREVETIGPSATKAEVLLRSADISPIAFRLNLQGLVLGNPAGYKTPTAIEVENISVRVKPGSLFSDKWVVDSIHLKGPVITLEGGMKNNNLKTLEKNLNSYLNAGAAQKSPTPGTPSPTNVPAKPERKLQVNEIVITGAKLHLDMKLTKGREITLSIPTIQLNGLGTGPEGITAAGVAQQTLQAILVSVTSTASNQAASLGKEAEQGIEGSVKKASRSLKNLFNH